MEVLKLWLIFIVCISTSYATIEDIFDDIVGDSKVEIAPCVKQLSQKYFKADYGKKSSTVFLNLLPDDETNSMLLQQKVLELLNEEKGHSINLLIKDDSTPKEADPRAEEKAKNYLILVTFPTEIVENIKKLQKLPTWNHLAQFIVVVTERFADQFEMEVVVSGTFKLFFDYSILDVYVLIQNLDNYNLLQSFIWFPYDGKSCSNILSYNNLVIIDECETLNITDGIQEYEIRELVANVSSRLPVKYHGCPLTISTNIWEPYVIGNVIGNENGDDNEVTGGIEVNLIKLIADKLDLETIFKIIDDSKAFSIVTDDEETGFYSDLIKRKTDLLIGGLYDNQVSRKLLSSTIPYYSDEMTWCVAKAGLAANWLNVFAIFDIFLWMSAVGTIFITGFVLHFIVRFENDRRENIAWSVLTVLAFSIGVYGHYNPRRVFIQVYVIIVCLYGMHFSAAYHSFLLSVLTRPRYEPQVSSVAMAVEQGFKFTGGENLKPLFVANDPVSVYLDNNYKTCYVMDQCLLDLKDNKKLAVAISRQHALNARVAITENDMYCFTKADNIFTYNVVMLVKRDHHFLPQMNTLIRRITESGFMLKWKDESEYVKSKTDVDKKPQDPHESSEALTLSHLLGMFFTMGIGVAFSFFGFFMEWIVYFLARKMKIKFVQKYIEEQLFCTF